MGKYGTVCRDGVFLGGDWAARYRGKAQALVVAAGGETTRQEDVELRSIGENLVLFIAYLWYERMKRGDCWRVTRG